jgi:hypothetical protein
MLEFMIALFLVATCALPLSQLPMQAVQEEYKSAYRMQTQRLADLAFSQIKEQLYREEIAWQDILRTRQDSSIVLKDEVEVCFEPLGKRKFNRLGKLHSVGKTTSSGDEWRLITCRVKITPLQKGYKLFRTKKNTVASRTFTYQTLVSKTSTPPPAQPVAEVPQDIYLPPPLKIE